MLDKSTVEFLLELRENNNRDWFHAQKKRYDKVKLNYKNFISLLLPEIQKHDPTLVSLTPKDCTFRIARDIRFSKDKTPYKTHLGVGMRTHGKRSGMAEYYVHLEPGKQSFVGGGIYMPDAEQMKKIRAEIDVFGEDLIGLINHSDFKKHYNDIDRALTLTRQPKGYTAEHPHIDLLKLKSYTAITSIPDHLLTDATLIPFLVERLAALSPFLSFLNRGLLAEEETW